MYNNEFNEYNDIKNFLINYKYSSLSDEEKITIGKEHKFSLLVGTVFSFVLAGIFCILSIIALCLDSFLSMPAIMFMALFLILSFVILKPNEYKKDYKYFALKQIQKDIQEKYPSSSMMQEEELKKKLKAIRLEINKIKGLEQKEEEELKRQQNQK